MTNNIKVNKLLLLGLLIVVSAAVLHIDWKVSDVQNHLELPVQYTLLQRPKAIEAGIEWKLVQEKWKLYQDKIAEGETNSDAKLALAELCIKEARVTGEHGHYYPMALELTDGVLNAPEIQTDLLFYGLTLKAGVQLSLHEFSQARETGLRAQELNPHNAQICGVLTDCYVELGEYDKAVQMADRMVAIRPDLRSYSRVAYLREIYGQVDGAIEALEMAITAGYPGDEETSWAMLTLADLCLAYGETEQAGAIYRRILMDRPNYPFAVAGLANVEWKKNNYRAAEAGFNRAVGIIPEVGFYIDLALMKKEVGQPYRQLTNSILGMLEEDTEAGHVMNMEYAGVYHDLLEDHQQALNYLNKEYQVRPNNIDVNTKMAQVYHALDVQDKAQTHLQAALMTDSQDPFLKEMMHVIAHN